MATTENEPRPATVVNGKLVRTSVSAMQLFRRCPARWWFKYASGLDIHEEEGAGAKRGKLGHKRLEYYQKTGEPVGDRLEQRGVELGYVPPPNPAHVIEGEFTYLKAGDIDMLGFIDLERWIGPGHIEVTDWKFKKNLDKYMSTSEDLLNPDDDAGLQMIAYGAAMAIKHGSAVQRITVRHVSFQTEGRIEVVPTVAQTQSPEWFTAQWALLCAGIIPAMKVAAEKNSHLGIAKNLDACNSYGKACPFEGTCKDRVSRIADGLRRLRPTPAAPTKVTAPMFTFGATPSAATTTVVQVPTPQPVAPPPPAPVPVVPAPTAQAAATPKVIRARDAIQLAVYTVAPGVKGRFLCAVTRPGSNDVLYSFASLVAGAGPIQLTGDTEIVTDDNPPQVLPPDAPASNPALAAKVDVPVLVRTPQTEAQTVAVMQASIAQAPPPAPAQTQTPAAAEPEKPKGRRPKKDLVDKGAPSVPAAAEPEPAQGPVVDGFALYFVGTPLGQNTRTLHDYVEMLDAELRKSAQIQAPDIRLAKGDFEFMKWKAFLSKLALEIPPSRGHYIVTQGDERVQCVADALIGSSKCFLVVR